MKRVLLSIILVVALPGCDWFTKKHPQLAETWPAYKVPEKPKLNIPETIQPGKNAEVDAMVKNVYDLQVYADSLKIILDTHNQAAMAHNTKVEQGLGIKGAANGK